MSEALIFLVMLLIMFLLIYGTVYAAEDQVLLDIHEVLAISIFGIISITIWIITSFWFSIGYAIVSYLISRLIFRFYHIRGIEKVLEQLWDDSSLFTNEYDRMRHVKWNFKSRLFDLEYVDNKLTLVKREKKIRILLSVLFGMWHIVIIYHIISLAYSMLLNILHGGDFTKNLNKKLNRIQGKY